MRLPHHLVRSSTGVFHFRQKVPLALQSTVGLRVIKRSLGTRDPRTAQARAYLLSARYAQAIEQAGRRARMAGDDQGDRPEKPNRSVDQEFPFIRWTGGFSHEQVTIQTDGTEGDHRNAMAALELFLSKTAPMSATDRTEMVVEASLPLGEAARKYLLTLEGATVPDKTKSQKRAAVNGFAKWKGLKTKLATCTRTDVAEWVQSLRAENLATPTLANKISYLKAFFAWGQSAGYFPAGDNPATGQVKYGTREKRLRRKLGFQPFSVEQLDALYDPKHLATLTLSVRWGALIGLYTGARVSEVGQLALDDFIEVDGVPCFRITAQGEGQSLKTDASERVVPIHPDLVDLGLLRRVQALRSAGEQRFFPRVKIGAVNGAGNFLSKGFGRHIESLGIKVGAGKVGLIWCCLR